MSFYLEFIALDRPFPFNKDDNQRVMFSMNFEAMARAPVVDWEQEIIKHLVTAGAIVDADAFVGPEVDIPAGNGPYTTIIDTGGSFPDETHNGDIYERLSVQIIVRAQDYLVARTTALAVWRALVATRNIEIAA